MRQQELTKARHEGSRVASTSEYTCLALDHGHGQVPPLLILYFDE